MIDGLGIKVDDSDDGPLSTYGEWHAASIGMGIGTAVVLAAHVGPAAVAIVAAIGIRLVAYAITGKRAVFGDRVIDLPDRVCRQIRNEPHYLTGGMVVGVIVMTVVATILNTIQL